MTNQDDTQQLASDGQDQTDQPVNDQVEVDETVVTDEETTNDDAQTQEEVAQDSPATNTDTDNTPDSQDDLPEAPEVPEVQEVKVDSPNIIKISDQENKKARWYVVHTYSGHENKVAETLKQRAQTLHIADKIIAVLIPTQEKIQIRRGQRKTVNEKIFPGYMLVQMELTDDAWLAVRTTQGVTGFVGVGAKPKPLPKHEVDAIKKYMSQGAPQYKAEFTEGEAVKITDGPFNDFLGTVQSIDEEKGKVEVLVSIFGRETPVELDFLQVQKVSE